MKQSLSRSDCQEILDLISLYGHTYDANDIERLCSLFKEDASLRLYCTIGATIMHESKSKMLIREFVSERRSSLAKQGIQPRHYQTNTILKIIREGKVKGVTMMMVLWQYPNEPEPTIVHSGFYRDQFEKTKGCWKFARREIHIDQSTIHPAEERAIVSKHRYS